MKDEQGLLESATKWQFRAREAVKLSDETGKYIDRRMAGLRRNALVVQAWEEAVSGIFAGHCELVDIKQGELVAAAEPGPYYHELMLSKKEILEHIKNVSGRNDIRSIRVIVKKRAE